MNKNMQHKIQIIDLPTDIQRVFNMFENNELYLVGGCIRDLLLGKKPHDYDFCTNLTPKEMETFFTENRILWYENNNSSKFGTLILLTRINEYEITTYRKESGYSDSRHPDKIEFTKDILEDLQRRDFTINAIAYHPQNGFRYVESALDDLQNGIIRAVGNPDDRFKEDPLRILRALRFAVKYGFTIEKETSKAIHKYAYLLKNISKERITDELRKTLTCGQPIHDIFLEYKDVIGVILPDFIPSFDFKQNNKYHKHDVYEHCLCVNDATKSDEFTIKLAAFLHDIGKPACYEFKDGKGTFHGHPKKSEEITKAICMNDLVLTKKEKEKLFTLVKYHDLNYENSLRWAKKSLNRFGEENLKALMVIHHADVSDHIFPEEPIPSWGEIFEIEPYLEQIAAENAALKISDLQINGNDLMNIYNIKQGPLVGEILNYLFDKVLNDEIKNERITLHYEIQMYLERLKETSEIERE